MAVHFTATTKRVDKGQVLGQTYLTANENAWDFVRDFILREHGERVLATEVIESDDVRQYHIPFFFDPAIITITVEREQSAPGGIR